MKKYFLIAFIGILTIPLKGQFFGRKCIGISQGAIFFNAPSLNNKNNANDKTSWLSEIDKNLSFARYWSLNLGAGVGNYKNPDDQFESYQSSNFYRIKLSLMLHLPSVTQCKDCKYKKPLLNPFLLVGYNFDMLDKTYKAVADYRANVNMKVGGGIVFRITDVVGCSYAFTLNQRINPDYRTFYQHNLGLLISLDKE